MTLTNETVRLLLSEDGVAVLEQAAPHFADVEQVVVKVIESEDLGLWVETMREDRPHAFFCGGST